MIVIYKDICEELNIFFPSYYMEQLQNVSNFVPLFILRVILIILILLIIINFQKVYIKAEINCKD